MVIVMNKEKRIPEIRFAGFTDDWEQRKLGDIAIDIVAGGDIDKNKIKDLGKYPVIANALTNDGIVGYYEDDFRIKAPAVTVTGRGNVGHAKARNTNFTPVVRLLSITSNHDINFLEKAINNINVVVESTGVPQLTVPQLEKYKIYIPNNQDEEKAIGTFFTELDNLITLHQQLLNDYKQFKKAMLQQLFPQKGESVPKIRFTGFNEDWKKERLSKYLNEISDKSTVENQHTILSSTTTGIEIRDGRVSGVSNLGYKIIKKGNVVLSPQNLWMGNINYNKEFEIGLVSPSYKTFSVENAEECFLVYYLKLPKMIYSYGQASVQGASVVRRNLDIDLFNQIVVLMPNREEQEKIGNFFKQLDETIEGHEQKLATYQELKKALLQRMFV